MATLASIIPMRREAEAKPIEWGHIAWYFLLLAVPLVLIGAFLPAILALLVTAVVIAPVVWKAPVRGVYFLTGAGVVVESYPLNYPDALTDRVPLFQNLSNVGVPGVAMSPLEVLIIEVVLIAFLRRRAIGQTLSLPGGPMAGAYLAFMGVLLFAELHGLVTGGSFKLSLWELRPQVYGFVMFLLAGSLLRTRRELLTLGTVVLCAVVFKAVLGTFRWLFTLDHSLTQETLLGHEDSYFMVVFLLALLAAITWGRRRSVLVPMLVTTPIVVTCLLANERRTAFIALGASVLVFAIMLLRFEPSVRKKVVVLVVVTILGAAALVGTNWTQSNGLAVQLVRPIRSLVDRSASARDASSDLYRVAEDSNLNHTFAQSPLVGLGFGMPFYVVTPMADISAAYPLWNVIPHNTIRWVPMRMGTLGMVTFWGLVGMAILEAFAVMRRRPDAVARAIAVVAVAALVSELIVAYGDLQLESYRNLLFVGALLGGLAQLASLTKDVDG